MVTLRISRRVGILILIGMLWASPWARAQSLQHPTQVVSTDRGCVLVLCGVIRNPADATDTDPATAMSLSPPLAASSAAVRLRFAHPVPVGTTLKLLVSFGGALNLGLLNATAIRTFAGTSSTVQQSVNLGTLLDLQVLDGSLLTVEFPVTASFTDFELRTGSLLNVNLAYTLNLHSAQAAASVPLPVTLVRFEAYATAAGSELRWETSAERNSAYFLVERATDAHPAFRVIGQRPGAGTSTTRRVYHFVDLAPAQRSYYRLHQVDRDGTVTYSSVVTVQASRPAVVQVSPNPTARHLLITGGEADTPYALLNSMGQTVRQGLLVGAQGSPLDLASLPDGMYLLRLGSDPRVLRVVKASTH